jgi:hypothetical protein
MRWRRVAVAVAVAGVGMGMMVWVRRELHRVLEKRSQMVQEKTRGGAAIADRAVTSPLNQPGGGTAPGDAYEVYSALYESGMDEPLVFAEDSVTDIPQVNGSCLRPSTEEERALVAAFEAANAKSRRWEKKFSIPQGYRLISRGEAGTAQKCLETHGRDAALCAAYRDVRYVRFLGVPGFDGAHRRALVSVVKMCGGFCGSGGIFEVEKRNGKWARAAGSDFTSECSWMY